MKELLQLAVLIVIIMLTCAIEKACTGGVTITVDGTPHTLVIK